MVELVLRAISDISYDFKLHVASIRGPPRVEQETQP